MCTPPSQTGHQTPLRRRAGHAARAARQPGVLVVRRAGRRALQHGALDEEEVQKRHALREVQLEEVAHFRDAGFDFSDSLRQGYRVALRHGGEACDLGVMRAYHARPPVEVAVPAEPMFFLIFF